MRSTLHNFWKLGLAPVPGSDPHKKKEKCDPLSTISVSSSWHLLEVLYFFFALPCASTEKKNEKKKKRKKKRTYIAQEFPRDTHNLMTAFDISVVLRHLSQKNWTDLGACFDYTHISQTWCIWNDNLYPTSTTRHMDGPWNDQPFWWARTSSQHRNLLKISMLLFFEKKKLRKERRGEVMWGKVKEGKVRRQGCGRGQVSENAKKNAKKKKKKLKKTRK